jgi:stearoyl-CoA desaturase (delta-9 desaturase)
MSAWASVTAAQIGWAIIAGFVLCELNNYLTSAVLHRGLCHGAIRYPAWLGRAAVVWLWATACVPPLSWIAAHRHHHANSDTEDDPHAPGRKGFWMVLLFTWYYVTRWARRNPEVARRKYLGSFAGERLLRALDDKWVCYVNFYGQIAISIALGPVALVLWLWRVPVFMVLNGYVNAVGHTHGERHYPNLGTDAAGPLLVFFGYLIGGEPLGHNYHHRFPATANFRPGRFDPGYWFATRVLRGVPRRAESAP